jgi:hypothetical protein
VIEGKQCTIAWNVDDTKISHVDPAVVTSIMMTVRCGLEHSFLGMKIRYTGKQRAIITMKQYLEEALSECGMDIVREVATPAQRDLFDVNENSPPLSKTDSIIFHSVCAKLLYVSLRASEGAFCSYCHYLLTIMIETKHIKMRNKHLWFLLIKLGL